MKYTPEQARVFLQEKPNPIGRDFWEALRDEALPTYFCQQLARFKLYSDDLPGPTLVDVWHPDYPQMKCRGNVITGIASSLRMCVIQEVVKDSRLIELINRYVSKDWNAFKGKGTYWTTREEIDLINTTLDRVIHSIETTYGITTDWKKARKELDEERVEIRKAYGK